MAETQTLFLNVGTDFSETQLERFVELNRRGLPVRIGSVYGGLRTDVLNLRSARPDFRVPNTDLAAFERYVRIAHENGIEVEYTANATMTAPLAQYASETGELISRFRYLESVGVTRVIVSNPLLMEMISAHTGLKIKASTILGINKPSALKYYAGLHVDSVCPDIYSNRNLPLLGQMYREGQKYGIRPELLANEVCFYGDTPCSQMLRAACYQHSSLGGNPDKLFSDWPFSRCREERKKHPICWLKIPYILPQHIRQYARETGITHFKISGRTNTTEYVFHIVESYLTERFSGDIEQLFMLPQNIYSEKNKRITVEELTRLKHFDQWLGGRSYCDYQCHLCGYCERIYEQLGS